MTNEPIISIKNLWKSFGKNTVLKGIDLTVNKGEDLVILGRSGSGKSVTIKCLVGLVEADKGEIVGAERPFERRGQIGIIGQHRIDIGGKRTRGRSRHAAGIKPYRRAVFP